MRALVTGGAGFIGSHLCERLAGAGWEVGCLDDLSTGARANVAALEGKKGFSLVEGSVLDGEKVAGLCRGCDVVYHLAAAVGVKLIVERPFLAIRTNVRGTETVLEQASRFGARVVLASSSEIYGKQTKDLLSEDDDRILGPTSVARWSYASTKALDEFLAFAYAEEKGLRSAIVRLFNVSGPRQTGQYGMVLPRFVSQALRGSPMTVYGDGSQTRTFSDVRDIVGALADIPASERAWGRVFNLGGTEEISMIELARRVIRVLESSSEVELIPYERAYGPGYEDMPRRVPDIARARELIGFKPVHDLDETIKAVAEWISAEGLFFP